MLIGMRPTPFNDARSDNNGPMAGVGHRSVDVDDYLQLLSAPLGASARAFDWSGFPGKSNLLKADILPVLRKNRPLIFL